MEVPAPFWTLVSATVLSTLTGTPIGTLVGGGGLAAGFDGITNQASGVTANANAPCWIGLTLSPAKATAGARVYGSNNTGFVSSAEPVVTIDLRGKTGAAPTSHLIDGTLLGSISFTDTANESAGHTVNSNDLVTAWDHIWVNITAGVVPIRFAELQIYGNVAAPANTLGFPITDSDLGLPSTVLPSGGMAATLVARGGFPCRLVNADGSRWTA